MLYLGGLSAIVSGGMAIWNGGDRRQGAIAVAIASAAILAGLLIQRAGSCPA
jgi:hypothetical protein